MPSNGSETGLSHNLNQAVLYKMDKNRELNAPDFILLPVPHRPFPVYRGQAGYPPRRE
jgi:hypothetical protein